MPKIEQGDVLAVLKDHYFDHHTAMHLARERVKVFDPQTKRIVDISPLSNPDHHCDGCAKMIAAGKDGSGRQFLQMHHDMIRVFRYLLEQKGTRLAVKWANRRWVEDRQSPEDYSPKELWDLDNPDALPVEIRSLFSPFDSEYLDAVYKGVEQRRDHPNGGDPIDELGKFIERGVKKSQKPDGHGFHNTIHDYLGSREGKSAWGAEMNRLTNSRFNDYFWSLHLWIDAQYGRLLENLREKFDTSAQNPGQEMAQMTHERTGTLAKQTRR